MSCTPLPKAAKPVWAKQLTRLPCLVVYVKFQLVYAPYQLLPPLNMQSPTAESRLSLQEAEAKPLLL